MITLDYFKGLAAQGPKPGGTGIVSVCSAHPWVIEAAFRHGLEHEGPMLIEVTCNQVNQFGGYTGMTPCDFRRFVEGIAGQVGFPLARLMLGGDHLSPNPLAGQAGRRGHGECRCYGGSLSGSRLS